MKPGSTSTPPHDEAPDPLLDALRQRLGNYGEAPPPAAWAAIRQRVAPPPLPWWRRGRRLLPLLALLAGMLLVSMPTARRSQQKADHLLVSRFSYSDNHNFNPKKSAYSPISKSLTSHRHVVDSTSLLAAVPPADSKNAELSGKQKSVRPAVVRPLGAPVVAVLPSAKSPTTSPRRAQDATQASEMRPSSNLLAKQPHRQAVNAAPRLATRSKPAVARRAGAPPAVTGAAQVHRAQPQRRATQLVPLAKSPTALTRPRTATAGSRTIYAAPASLAGLARRRHVRPGRALRPARVTAERNALAVAGGSPSAQSTSLASLSLSTRPSAPLDTLALKQASLFLPQVVFLPVLAARPDSVPPPPLVRRWALLVVAGPTLSYRTLGPAPTLAAGHPDFARLERPALGLGAQVQVRRVLSSRWAVAAGVGYHEYATRLALSLKDTARVQQRDTYRLLTAPVQFGYAFGAPKDRLSKGLLLGLEPGWYIGGRSTEGSGCGCEQQAYSSAGGSPYRSLTVAFSLGLDVRLRLGGAASRWQWLVQPTGRYVATPFVRADALGFTRRQPFSLDLLTGFSWDVR